MASCSNVPSFVKLCLCSQGIVTPITCGVLPKRMCGVELQLLVSGPCCISSLALAAAFRARCSA